MAHVHVVIVGMSDKASKPSNRRLFIYKSPSHELTELEVGRIGPYLANSSRLTNPHTVVDRARRSLASLPEIRVGTKPVDGGIYVLNREERDAFLEEQPNAADLLRPFFGGQEFINGRERWLLFPASASPARLRTLPAVMRRISAVRKYRKHSAGKLAQSLAARPMSFHVTVAPESNFLVIPEVSSERREYVPIGYLSSPTIPSNQLLVVDAATLPVFALLTSSMHMAWLRTVGGRLESRYRYSSGLVYNTFPTPLGFAEGGNLSSKLRQLAQGVLNARAVHPDATLADLYDPDLMPANLRNAHARLDSAVDSFYRRAGFTSERERVEHMFMLYEKMHTPLEIGMKGRARWRSTRNVGANRKS